MIEAFDFDGAIDGELLVGRREGEAMRRARSRNCSSASIERPSPAS
jgi:hypothetical protein